MAKQRADSVSDSGYEQTEMKLKAKADTRKGVGAGGASITGQDQANSFIYALTLHLVDVAMSVLKYCTESWSQILLSVVHGLIEQI